MKTEKYQVLAIGHKDISYSQVSAYHEFSEKFDILHYNYISRSQFLQDLQSEQFSNISAIWNAAGGLISSEGGLTFNEEVISRLPARLKVITISAIGYEKYDLVSLGKRGIKLCNSPSLSSSQVADMALYLTLSSFRFTSLLENSLRATLHTNKAKAVYYNQDKLDWTQGKPTRRDPSTICSFSRGDVLGGKKVETPQGKSAGIVGLGSIGVEVAKRLNAIGMSVRYTKRNKLSEANLKELSLHFRCQFYETFEDLARSGVDLLVFCLPSTPATKNLLNKQTLALCKRGVRIVNIGRGDVINETDLITALDEGTVTSAGLDVFQNEPNVNPDLVNRWDVTSMPHVASGTVENRYLAAECAWKNITEILIHGGEGFSTLRP